jgi:hypothetical protein
MMTGYPVAFADEAFINPPNRPGFYLFAGIVVDSDDLTTVMDAARQAAGIHAPFHATDLHHRGHMAPIEDMLDAVHAHAGWNFLVAQAPIPRSDDNTRSQEKARQTALAQLLHQLNDQKVRDVVVDTRASQREQVQTQLEGRKVTVADLPDVTTYRNLVRANQISARMRLLHVDDRQQPGLWMADAAVWSFQRAIASDDPRWWSRITDVSTVVDAQTGRELSLDSNRAAPPNGEHGPEHLSQSAQASLLTSQYYTPPGGTTNRQRGPGQLFTSLLHQIETAHGQDLQQHVLQQVIKLNRGVSELTTAIHQSTDAGQPVLPTGHTSITPEPEPPDPEPAHTTVTDPTID